MNFIEIILKNYISIRKPGFVYFGHGIVSDEKTPFFPNLQMQLSEFMNLIDYWEKMGFRFISFEELSDVVLHKKNLDFPWIHLTFDDGYKNNFTTLYPFIKSKNIPVTIFISTRHIIERRRFDNYIVACGLKNTLDVEKINTFARQASCAENQDRSAMVTDIVNYYMYLSLNKKEEFLKEALTLLTPDEWQKFNSLYDSEELMSEAEIREISKDPLVKIAAHGHNHYILSTLDEIQLGNEFLESKKIVQQLTGQDPIAFCYPNGKKTDFSDRIEKICEENGYKFAFTTIENTITYRTNHFRIPRIALSSGNLLKKVVKICLPLMFN